MIQDRVTATELVRNLSALLDQVRVSRKRIAITRGNQQVAQLTPPAAEGASANTLETLLAKHPMNAEQKTAYHQDIDEIRHAATLPPSPWES